ncbi:DUF3140 domain-containing protein [Actinosynnema sp. NPDC023794]
MSGEFEDAVNMTAAESARWSDTDESRSDGGESVGHESGRRIVDLPRTKKGELTEDDQARVRKVVGYVHRHLAQRPEGDVTHTRWRYSLMNWVHDPLKD